MRNYIKRKRTLVPAGADFIGVHLPVNFGNPAEFTTRKTGAAE